MRRAAVTGGGTRIVRGRLWIGIVVLLAAGLLGGIVEYAAAAEEIRATKRWPGTIEARTLNVRSGPGQNYEIVDTLSRGDEVIVVEQMRNWVRLEREGEVEGWVYRQFVHLPENFMQPLFSDAENAFLDWASAIGLFHEISVEADGRIAVILKPELYQDPAAAREAGVAAACAYREHIADAGAVTVVIWAEQGPATGFFGEVSCPN